MHYLISVCFFLSFNGARLCTQVKALTEPLQLTEERHFNLRGRSLECLGHLAVAVGKDGFAPYLAMGMHSAEMSLQMDAPELHEYTYAFFGTACRVIGSDFAQFLPTLVPHLCEVGPSCAYAHLSRLILPAQRMSHTLLLFHRG